MDAGFSNLTTLKALTMPAALAAKTQFDVQIAGIGKGVAGQIAQYCNRDFRRLEDAQEIYPADRSLFKLRRYPLEAVTTMEVSDGFADGLPTYGALDLSALATLDPDCGIIQFFGRVSGNSYRVRFTYTGGLWWQTEEPFLPDGTTDNPDYATDTLPDGATQLPDSLVNAWAQICQMQMEAADIFQKASIDGGAKLISAARSAMWPEPICAAINSFRRFA